MVVKHVIAAMGLAGAAISLQPAMGADKSAGAALAVSFKPCSKGPDGRGHDTWTLSGIRVNGAQFIDEDQGGVVVVTKGSKLTFTLTGANTKAAPSSRIGVYWMSKVDMVFRGVKPNFGPVVAGEKVTGSFDLTTDVTLPGGHYPVKIKISHASHLLVCATFSMRIIDPS
ncbi:hypothetical protein [Hyalangium sp.]|uniref:hypothetical protein n=1 Tax=Hyalangium sp. TaxID=2028555 RepID=UPI002D357590|nr:hypothetical protein [Hyalangium sp.]HYI01680.1 hypothetical protein [Hyalangium sp.]